MLVDRLRHGSREQLAIDRERRARWHACDLRGMHHQGVEPAHLLFQQADRVVELVASEGIAAHELGEAIRLVDFGRPRGPHFVDGDGHAARCGLPGSLATSQAASDDMNHLSPKP